MTGDATNINAKTTSEILTHLNIFPVSIGKKAGPAVQAPVDISEDERPSR